MSIGNGSNNGGVFAWFGNRGQVEGFAPDVSKPNGRSRCSGGSPSDADPTSLVATACRLAGADITRAQWHRYVGDRPYQHVCPRGGSRAGAHGKA